MVSPGKILNMTWLRRPWLAALFLVLVWLGCRLICLKFTGIPQPVVQDEFSYLLGADTFAHGRLANPALPLGQFFESPHELVRPKYASKFPPGQAMFLALGQRLFGSPFYGVLIGNALMLFALCMMLFTWVAPRWAFAVSVMFGLALSPAMYWTNSYWGGSVAAGGGALVLLSIGIYRSKQTAVAGAIFSVGALLLFWTRPYEGGVFTLAVLAIFSRELWRKRSIGALLTGALVFAVGGVWTCYYNRAVTGNPILLPYLLHARQYDMAPVFWILPLRPEPNYSDLRLATLHGASGWEVSQYKILGRGPHAFWHSLTASIWNLGLTLGVSVLITLILPVAWGDPLYRKMAIVTGIFLLALALETFHAQHYTAPAWPALGLMIAVWADHAWESRVRNVSVGKALVILGLIAPAVVVPLPHFLRSPQGTSSAVNRNDGTPISPGKWSVRRAALLEALSRKDRPQLVIVKYPSPDWRSAEEWVYNGADIDHQRVILAHDFGAQLNRSLLEYYSGRTPLLLTFDAPSGRETIAPYPVASSRQ